MTDLPMWVQAAAQTGDLGVSALALYVGIRNARGAAALKWTSLLEDVSGLDPEELRTIVEENPAIAELVGIAWESAARTAAEDKRILLAKAVAAAMQSRAEDEVDPYLHLVRTITLIEASEIKLLTVLARPQARTGDHALTRLEGAMTQRDMQTLWPGAGDLLLPMVAVLNREGLIYDAASGTMGFSESAWRVTHYGFRLLRYLPGDTSWLDQSEVSVVLQGDTNLTVLNLGPGLARTVRLSDVRPPQGQGSKYLDGHPPEPFDLSPGEERVFKLSPPAIGAFPPYVVEVEWEDVATQMRRLQIDTRERAPNISDG